MTDVAEIATQLAALAAVKKVIVATEANLKAEFLTAHGRGTLYPTIDGHEVAAVVVAKGRAGSWYVADPAAFLAWCRVNHPTALVETVRTSDQSAILAGIPKTGEVPDGVEMGEDGEAGVRVTMSAAQGDLVADAWRNGRISLPALAIGAAS